MAFLYTNNESEEREIRKQSRLPSHPREKKKKTFLKRQKTCTLKIIRYWWKKSKMTQLVGKIHYAHGLEELIFSKWLYYLRQSTFPCNLYQITLDIPHRTLTKYFKVCLEAQQTQDSKRHPEKEKWRWENQAPGLQTLLQSNNHQNRMILAQRQKYR